ncbi:MAG: peptidoglycan DD-metalloendopeptidase family protein [Candidatus Poribacteria bacterium]
MSRGCRSRFICLSVLLELSLLMGLGIYIFSHYNSSANDDKSIQVADQCVNESYNETENPVTQSSQNNSSKSQKSKCLLPTNIGGPYIDAPSLQMNFYYAKKGDNLASIAKENNLDFFTILSVNGLEKSNDISIGQKLRIPNQRGILHKVRRGESIEDIALMYDVNIRKIIRVNQILDPEDIKPGMELFIPDAKTTLDFQKQLLAKSGIVYDDDGSKGSISRTIVSGKITSSKKVTASNSSKSKRKSTENVKFASDTTIGLPCDNIKTSSNFGYRRDPFNGRRAFHAGVDLTPGYGSDVYSAIDGTVTYAGWMGGYGKLVVVTSKDGVSTRYGHLSKISVRKGAEVRKGQKLGDVGSTGRSTGAHLHFEVRQDDKPLNPIKFLNGKAELISSEIDDSSEDQEELSEPAKEVKETANKSSKTSTKKKVSSKKTTKSKKS